jgi:hypothetical protein
MSNHKFRNPDKLQVLPFREWIRDVLPSGSKGTVVEDLDLVVRVYGRKHGTDATGKFMLIELKHGNSWIGVAQKKTFGLIDNLLRTADPFGKRYTGYFIIQYSCENWYEASFKVNRTPLTKQQFIDFLQFDETIIETIPSWKL